MIRIRRLLRRAFLDSWREADTGAETAKNGDFDWRPIVVLATTAVTLTLAEYYGGSRTLSKFVDRKLYTQEEWALLARAWWVCVRVTTYVVIPAMTVVLMPGERLRDYYVTFRGFVAHLWIYVGLYLLVLPLVLVVAQFESFQHTYPFYKFANQSWGHLLRWEALYALQFVALEFFFRGYMLKGLSSKFGYGAIFVMIVPYTMIHYPKPILETLGAIVAGVALGTLAMRTRSIWGGVIIHIAVAVTMDWLALAHCPPAGEGPCR